VSSTGHESEAPYPNPHSPAEWRLLSTVFTIDHDSYGVTEVDARDGSTRAFPVAPRGVS